MLVGPRTRSRVVVHSASLYEKPAFIIQPSSRCARHLNPVATPEVPLVREDVRHRNRARRLK